MKNTVKFNLSTIMRRAHELFKKRFMMTETFGDCLRQAWRMAKAYAMNGKPSLMHGVEFATPARSIDMATALIEYYNAGTNGRTYFGD